MLQIFTFPTGLIDTNVYLCVNGRDCVLVDAPQGTLETVGKIIEKNRLNLRAIFLTHGHWDHSGGIAALQAAAGTLSAGTPVPVYAHADSAIWLEQPQISSPLFRMAFPQLTEKDFPATKIGRILADDEEFELLGVGWKALHVPGHCPGSLAFYCESAGTVFVGDALFKGSVGRTDLFGGDYRLLCRSIREKLMTLPAETRVLPGHGDETTIGDEARDNACF